MADCADLSYFNSIKRAGLFTPFFGRQIKSATPFPVGNSLITLQVSVVLSSKDNEITHDSEFSSL